MPNKPQKAFQYGRPGFPSIREYLAKKYAYDAIPWRIDKGGNLLAYWAGKWITEDELHSFFKKPILPNFTANLLNCDKTRVWQHL